MKTLPFKRGESNDRTYVDCSGTDVSVHSKCAYCAHCQGVMVGRRKMRPPQRDIIENVRRGGAQDEELLTAAMMFNTLVRDGDSLLCDDEKGTGYVHFYKL